MSSDLLRRAAVKLREHVQAMAEVDILSEGIPWTVEDDDEDAQAPYVVANLTEFSTVYIAEGYLSRAHADFGALVHPPVALALADLLDAMAPFTGHNNNEELRAVARAVLRESEVDDCPDCGAKGRYDGRVHIGGRGVYRCPAGHAWQDADEVPSDKGYAALREPEEKP